MHSRFPAGLALAALIASTAGCGGDRSVDRVAQHASLALGVPAKELRITVETELTGTRHDFFLATTQNGKSLVVVAPKKGDLFDAATPGAFDKVAKDEQAAERLSQLGAERVAGWYTALGGNACPLTPSDTAHFVSVAPQIDGTIKLSYENSHRVCQITLRPDGTLAEAKAIEALGPRAAASHWQSEKTSQ